MNDVLRDHEIRSALLELLAEVGTVTATEAANRLGHSSGLCSFHLRQLERHGLIEEAPHTGGRARPWRLKQQQDAPADDQFGDLARGLEDESWQRWLDLRDRAPADWPREEAFSTVAYLTAEEMKQIAGAIQKMLARYQDREQRPLARPEGALPVALIARLFPLLPEAPNDTETGHG
ncbi:DNA-binding transcriptional regulator GbsR (MarR family) [Catenulispora sp. GP43]|uniref:helix-turn-helix domain-containing protein n=1 Tax=Catenulispora sp. GP43 TaxID=3156263 RepID=UPI003519849D